jgi:Flp pilus assembly CpaE family ATPase
VQPQRVIERCEQSIRQPTEPLADALGIERADLLRLRLGIFGQAAGACG